MKDFYKEFDYTEDVFNANRAVIMDSETFETVRPSNDRTKMIVQTKELLPGGFDSETVKPLLASDNYKSIDI